MPINDSLTQPFDCAVIGAGITGIACAYYLKKAAPHFSVALVDFNQPMSFTSAQSGENYRNWWPHPVMTGFMNTSIDLMEEIARETGNHFNMTRRGYVLISRSDDIDDIVKSTLPNHEITETQIRVHQSGSSATYLPPRERYWKTVPEGVDIIQDKTLIREHFGTYDPDIRTIIHIGRAGDINSQQLAQYMLETFRNSGGQRFQGRVTGLDKTGDFVLDLENHSTTRPCPTQIVSARVINAAGPFLNDIAEMLGEKFPVENYLQQKITFSDKDSVVPRTSPFSIDLDPQILDWTDEERELLSEDPSLAWVCTELPSAVHCKAEGGTNGNWIKLGWALNRESSEPTLEPALSDTYPEIVLRGAARLFPGLKTYYGALPGGHIHYGGYYTMTEENWPLIGPMNSSINANDARNDSPNNGGFVAGAMSGFGTMAAAASGWLISQWVLDLELPPWAPALSPARYDDAGLMAKLRTLSDRGVL